ncbi:hypothetical protein K435DRAFT_867306 [Dendrothele bispora CBS 962.96]|uniref:Family A G protein-coupled receptor-like protein n=1 Tax=Dendrothele bispora (strain CBS 962.96) TaxID=1314807 RepID=A0A4S8LES1_DENBC|nr:hypothetical protein K435DRAFT_867306 [Dendrothele bispora CBS 962.96]
MHLLQIQKSLPLSDVDILAVKEWVFETALAFLLLGIQTTLSIAVLGIFVAQGFPLSKAKFALSFVTIMMLFISLTSLVMNVEFIIIQIPLNGYNPPDLKKTASSVTELEIGLNFLSKLNFIIGDTIVVWRAWVLFPQRLLAKMVLLICLMGSFVGVILDAGLLVKRVTENPSELTGGDANVILLATPLIITNLIATTLIGLKAWYHFQSIQNNLGLTNGSSSKALKILLLLIESGLLYLAFWIGYLALGLAKNSSNLIAEEVYLAIMPELVAIYPVLIILVVALQNNNSESVNDMSLSQSIQFASVQLSKSVVHDSSGESQPASPAAGIGNSASAEVEGNEIEVVPRLS